MTEEEKKNRNNKIRNTMRKLEMSREEAIKYLDELSDQIKQFNDEKGMPVFRLIGMDSFGKQANKNDS